VGLDPFSTHACTRSPPAHPPADWRPHPGAGL